MVLRIKPGAFAVRYIPIPFYLLFFGQGLAKAGLELGILLCKLLRRAEIPGVCYQAQLSPLLYVFLSRNQKVGGRLVLYNKEMFKVIQRYFSS